MTFDWWTLGLQTLNVVILLWLLSRFLFKPVAAIVAERQRKTSQLLDEAAKAKTAAEQARVDSENAKAALARQRTATRQDAEQEAAAIKAQLIQQAQGDAERLRQQATAELEKQRQAMQAQLDKQATQLALDIAAKLLDRLPPTARVAGFMDGLVAGLQQLPSRVQPLPAREVRHWQLHAPRALSAQELADCQQALDLACGQPVTLEVHIDPTLIAGLELQGDGIVVRNSFRADLAQLQTELGRLSSAQ